MNDPLTQNRLLASLPAADRDELRPHLELLGLELAYPLIQPQEPIRHAYFPVTCLASLVIVLEDGSTVESGSVGREGMVGIPIVLGAGTTPMQTVIQVPGETFRIDADTLKEQFDRRGALHTVLTRYIHTLFMVASQSAACNRRHSVDARLARWLLMSSDGIGSNSVAITQEFLATMLGVRRAGVTEGALKLQNAGWIAYSRGLVEILDRPALENAACECYHVVRQEYERLFGTVDSRTS
ncbi:MAG TPA: Crp/Fnr family transcriptional regulator [Thermoanaerobaculia bacterium]